MANHVQHLPPQGPSGAHPGPPYAGPTANPYGPAHGTPPYAGPYSGPPYAGPYSGPPYAGQYPPAPYTATLEAGRRRLEAGLDFFYRQRLTVLLVVAVAVAAAAAYAYMRPPSYVTSSLVRVELAERAPDASSADEAPAEDVFATNDRPLLAEVFLLQTSVTLRQRVAGRLEAMQRGAAPGDQKREGAVAFGVADMAANTILITAESDDPEQAALVANLYAEEYVRLTSEAQLDRLASQRTRVEEWEEQRRQELERIEAEQRAQATSGAALGSGQEGVGISVQISNLEARRDQVQTELQTRRASLRTAEADLAALEPALTQRVVADDEEQLRDLQAQAAALRSERASTERRYPDEAQRDPRVAERLQQIDADLQRVEAEAEELSRRLVAASGLSGGATGGATSLSYAAGLRQRIREDRVAISTLEGQAERIEVRLAEQYAELRRLPQAAMAQASRQIAQAQMERERLYAAQTHQETLGQLRELRAAEEAGTGYARVMQSAPVPAEPAHTPASRLLLLGAFVGLSLGLGLALVRDRVDNRIYKPDQLREWGYPVLATIPNLAPLLQEEFGGEEHVEVGGRRLSTRLVTLLAPMSPPAEAYRHLRTNVLSRPEAPHPVKVLLVTSPGPQDGKSTTAANLAVSLAEGGYRTLLLDADLRRPTVHKVFGVPRTPGLIQHLLGDGRGRGNEGPDASVGAEPGFTSVGVDSLFVVPAGEAAAMGDGAASGVASATALSSAATTGYLQWLREQFDFVVIDTPPVLATTDALQLARQCDAVLVAVRARQTREGELSHTLEALEQVGAPIVGTVLNGFDVSMAYGYKYRYRSYTEYGPYPDYGEAAEQRRARRGKPAAPAVGEPPPSPQPGA